MRLDHAYFQRVLSTRSVRDAQILSFCGGIGCILLSIPPAVIGIIAQNVDWAAHNSTAILHDNPSMVLPLVIGKCTPSAVTFVALVRTESWTLQLLKKDPTFTPRKLQGYIESLGV